MCNKINILQLISSTGFFGAEHVMLHLSSELKTCGAYNNYIGVFKNMQNPHIEVAEECNKCGLKAFVMPCKGRFDMKAAYRIRRFIRQNNINIIHTHGYKSNMYSFLATIGLGVRRAATCHNWLGDDIKMRAYAQLDQLVLKRFDVIIAVSEDIKNILISSGIPRHKIHIIHNGINTARFTAKPSTIKNELGIEDMQTVIGTVGRISSEKGHRTLLNCSRIIFNNFPQTVFLIVGDGPLRAELQSCFDDTRIIFTGIRNDLPAVYSAMDIFALPSLTEGLPLVVLEAMASRLPVVATRVGAVPTIIKENISGLLVDPGDESGLVHALLYLLKNKALRQHMGENGYQDVNAYFSANRMAKEYSNLYQNVLNN